MDYRKWFNNAPKITESIVMIPLPFAIFFSFAMAIVATFAGYIMGKLHCRGCDLKRKTDKDKG